MAKTGLEIFKLLPKTNCGECGFPTCMAFSMKLAAKQVEAEKCPHIDDDVIDMINIDSAPPIRKITIGIGDDALVIGAETVMFRHEKTFVHPPGIGILIEDTSDESEIIEKAKKVDEVSFERVEQQLKPKVVAVKASSGDSAKFINTIKKVSETTKAALVLVCEDPDIMRAALDEVAESKPLIYAATIDNHEAMAGLANEFSVPLAVKADDLEKLTELSEKVAAAGVKDLVLDPGTNVGNDYLRDVTYIRRAALKNKLKPLGYPIITMLAEVTSDPEMEMALAGLYIMKYSGIIVLNDLDPARVMPLMVLLQNIYTDPQKPMQMSQGIYPVGDANEDSPVLITTNFSLTYFIVSGEIEASKVPSWLCVMDVEGLSVLTAWAAGKFVPEGIAKFLNESEIGDKVKHRKLVVPGYVSQISGELDDELSDWSVDVGPREAGDLVNYLKQWSPN